MLFTLDDEKEIEICIWRDGILFLDISMDKSQFEETSDEVYQQYLKSKGLLLANFRETNDTKGWAYLGLDDDNSMYKVRFIHIECDN